MELSQIKKEIKNPQFDHFSSCGWYSWQAYVPLVIKNKWNRLPVRIRLYIFVMAYEAKMETVMNERR